MFFFSFRRDSLNRVRILMFLWTPRYFSNIGEISRNQVRFLWLGQVLESAEIFFGRASNFRFPAIFFEVCSAFSAVVNHSLFLGKFCKIWPFTFRAPRFSMSPTKFFRSPARFFGGSGSSLISSCFRQDFYDPGETFR